MKWVILLLFSLLLAGSFKPPTERIDWAMLGESLFFDPLLSKEQSISCASCHLPSFSFSDTIAFSIGADGQTIRNTPALINLNDRIGAFNWDGKFTSLEAQLLHAIQNPLEMGIDLKTLEVRLKNEPFYQDIAQNFPENLTKALAAFLKNIEFKDAKYDRVLRGEALFTISEERGWGIFFDAVDFLPNGECSHCHTDPLFSSEKYFNNGLDVSFEKDLGRGGITGNIYETGMFRTPSLRNIASTAPYMHDGRFKSLEEVIEHYNSGGKNAFNANANVLPLKLTEEDKADLIDFLNTLSNYY
jgi:cytochrome c peroxidase